MEFPTLLAEQDSVKEMGYSDAMEIYFWQPRSKVDDFLARQSRFFSKRLTGGALRATNFGDELGPWIVKRMLDALAITPSPGALSRTSPALLSVGSVIQMARNGDVVWGTGHLGGKGRAIRTGVRDLRIHALRGPLTRKLLVDKYALGPVPEVFGDPAVLIPHLFPEIAPVGKSQTLIIPHLDDQVPRLDFSKFELMLPSSDFLKVISTIAGAERLITSSLHGKIIADAYGVPCNVYKGRTTNSFKFQDYALGTGQSEIKIFDSLELAMQAKTSRPKTLEGVMERLFDSFPRDIWH